MTTTERQRRHDREYKRALTRTRELVAKGFSVEVATWSAYMDNVFLEPQDMVRLRLAVA